MTIKDELNFYISDLIEYNYIMFDNVVQFARLAGAEHLIWFDDGDLNA
jgi:hypothetical protein